MRQTARITHDVGRYAACGIAAERTSRGWTQHDLAAQLGWSQSKVSALERGQRTLTLDQITAACRALQVPLTKLLDGAEPGDLEVLGLESPKIRQATI